MREQLTQYVNLLFAGTSGTEDIKQEILQNTLDRYDDLIAQGKQPEAAYRLAISGIGDINEILGGSRSAEPSYADGKNAIQEEFDSVHKRILRAVAVALYIISPTPLFVLSDFGMDTIGLCGTLAIIAVATVLIILGKKKGVPDSQKSEEPLSPKQELHSAVHKIINTIGLILYFIISFSTGAWYITWLIFPIEAAVWGLVKACMDLKEALDYEN